MLFSAYSVPNILFPLFGGILIDRIGVRSGIVIFSSVLVIGQISNFYLLSLIFSLCDGGA